MYTLFRNQDVTASLTDVWQFLRNPANLDLITPEDLRFQIVSSVPATMFNGLIIEYRIKTPVSGREHGWRKSSTSGSSIPLLMNSGSALTGSDIITMSWSNAGIR